MRFLRLFFWLVFFLAVTFCWIVVIEHGLENFFEGTQIEVENLQFFTERDVIERLARELRFLPPLSNNFVRAWVFTERH